MDRVLEEEAYYILKAQGDIHVRHNEEGFPTFFIDPEWIGDGVRKVNFNAYFNAGRAKVGIGNDWPPPEGSKPVRNGHWASVRQIGWEADQAFIEAGF